MDARAIVDETRKETLRWAIYEARKFQGKAAAGELLPAEKGKIPTLRQLIDGTVAGHKFRDTVAKGEPERILAAFASIMDRAVRQDRSAGSRAVCEEADREGTQASINLAVSSHSECRTG